MNNQEPTNSEILEAINNFATNTEGRFQGVENNFQDMEGRFKGIEKEITAIKATMVTKDYLDDKLSDLKGDLVVLMRKEDAKLCGLVDLLKNKKVISEEEAKNILAM